ncbi:Hypothetical protein GLP15_3817 [Giardia lamblia P15]|uniref:Uncharacterized protein n=1 Tax=Giardia intestinalis (strain P15) TaxID=658858 RepID=E1EWJ2_GIAIA|nr:Hypothetical protein GLP15_3817 [Giardia lamblia P15]
MQTYYCADISPSLAELALSEARHYREIGKTKAALSRYDTYIWLQRRFLNQSTDDREQKDISKAIRQAKAERDAIRSRRVPVHTGPLRSFKYCNWSLEGTHRQRLYTPAATGLYMTMHLVGPTSVEKKRYLQDLTDTLPCQHLYTAPSSAWGARSLFTSSGLTSLKPMDAVIDGQYRPEVVHTSLIANATGLKTMCYSTI